jgi:DNA-binding PadR family transcriptional regulator
MLEWGLVKERWELKVNHPFRRRILSITERGRRLLQLYDKIGELVKEIREEKGQTSQSPRAGNRNSQSPPQTGES